jgi:hypothetical protein
MFHVRYARQSVRELRKVRDASGSFEVPGSVQVLHQRYGVDGLFFFAQLNHCFEDVAMLGEEKVIGSKLFDRYAQRFIIKEDGT